MAEARPDKKTLDWRKLHLWEIQPIRDALVILLVIGLFTLGKLLSLVTVPILLALTLAYLFEPLVQWATRKRWMSRPGAAVLIVVLVAALAIVPAVFGAVFAVSQGMAVAREATGNIDLLMKSVDAPEDLAVRAQLPGGWVEIRDYIVEQEERARKWSARLAAPAPEVPEEDASRIEPPSAAFQLVQTGLKWLRENKGQVGQQALASGVDVVGVTVRVFGSVGLLAFGAFLTAFFFYFFCTGYGKVLEFWHGLIPERRRGRWLDLLGQMDKVISAFVRGRLTICLILMVVFTGGFAVIGMPAPLLLGPVVGLLTLVPYASSAFVPIGILLMWLDPSAGFRGEWWWIIGAPIALQILTQTLDDYVLTPSIQGKSTGMDTPTILFASIAGGVLAGFYGLLLAIPVAACIKILMKELFWPRFRAWAEGRERDFLPIAQGKDG